MQIYLQNFAKTRSRAAKASGVFASLSCSSANRRSASFCCLIASSAISCAKLGGVGGIGGLLVTH